MPLAPLFELPAQKPHYRTRILDGSPACCSDPCIHLGTWPAVGCVDPCPVLSKYWSVGYSEAGAEAEAEAEAGYAEPGKAVGAEADSAAFAVAEPVSVPVVGMAADSTLADAGELMDFAVFASAPHTFALHFRSPGSVA